MADSVDITGLKRLLKRSFPPLLLDVRRKSDYVASPNKIKSANWHDPEMINEWSAELFSGKKIIVYCVKGGSVSQSVVERLEQEGHDVVFLEGGIKAWVDSGGMVTTSKRSPSRDTFVCSADDTTSGSFPRRISISARRRLRIVESF